MTHQYNRPNNKPKPKSEPIEAKIIISLLRGIIWLVTWPFKRGQKNQTIVRKASGTLNVPDITRRWSDIQTTVGLGGVAHFGSSIVAADKLLDYVLRQKGYAGETMGERLRSAQYDLSHNAYNAAWQAHKLRNQLVHEVESEVLSFQAKEALQNYELVLRELGAIR